jgi:single-strand DNA-binding protein
MLKVNIIGHVGKDAEMKYTPSGQAVTQFSVAHTEQYTNAGGEQVKKTVWVRVSAWGKLAENCSKYVRKGMLVHVEGKLNADENGNPKIYTKQDGTAGSNFDITAFTVLFLSKVEGNAQTEQVEIAEEDVPF